MITLPTGSSQGDDEGRNESTQDFLDRIRRLLDYHYDGSKVMNEAPKRISDESLGISVGINHRKTGA